MEQSSGALAPQVQSGLYPQGNAAYNRPPGVGMPPQYERPIQSTDATHNNYQGSDGNKTDGHAAGSSSTSGVNDAAHRKQVLKQQQQRLLLLRHASKCPKEKCDVTQHCASMKLLWKHIMSCKEQQCKTPHCVSSRYVLSHYSKCKETKCPVCGPVRDAIIEHYSKNNALQNTKSQGGGAPVANKKGGGKNTAPAGTTLAANDGKGQ